MGVRAEIEKLQPYYTGTAWQWDSLWILNELARFDRHRFLHPAVMRTGDVRSNPAVTRNVKIRNLETAYGEQVIEDPEWDEDGTPGGAVLATFTAESADPNKEMHVEFLAPLQLGFDLDSVPSTLPFMEHEDIIGALQMIEIRVSGVIRTLRPFLPSMRPY